MNINFFKLFLRLQNSQNWQSVADRINELEKQQNQPPQQFLLQMKNTANPIKPKYSYLDPSKTHRVPNPALKAFQKNAIQSYFERQTSAKLNSSNTSIDRLSLNGSFDDSDVNKRKSLFISESKFNGSQFTARSMKTDDIPPNPPPRKPILRRTSSVSEYSSFRDKVLQSKQNLSKDLLQPMLIGPIISVDDWEAPMKIPDRPPKNPMLRAIVCKSPDLPPPPPVETSDLNNLENLPLPSPPPELRHPQQLPVKIVPESDKITNRRNSFAGHGNNGFLFRTSTLENLMASQLPYRTQNSTESPAVSQRHSMGVIGSPSLHPPDLKFNKNVINDKIINNQNVQFKFSKAETPRKMIPDRNADFRPTDTRLSIRKRAHNSKDIIISQHQTVKNLAAGNNM